jgi:hypothetical protein
MKTRLKTWTVPILLLILVGISFGLLIPTLGYYWDDWPSLMIYKIQGLDGFRQFFALDRPTTYLSYDLLMPLLGTNAAAWQIFSLSFRWLSAVLIWWLCRRMWPETEELAILAGAFFAVYPVFRQQSIALTYHQLWMEFAFFLFSLVGMVEAVRCPRRYWVWTGLAVGGLLLNFLISEYFLGTELVRPILLWVLISRVAGKQAIPQRLKRTLLHWTPYLVFLGLYLIWRFKIMELPGPDRNSPELLLALITTPVAAILKLAQMAIQDFIYILVTSWYTTFQPGLFDLENHFNLLSLGVGMAAAFLVGLYLLVGRKNLAVEAPNPSATSRAILLVGLFITAIGPLPAWVTNRQVIIGAWSDRLAVPAMLGASIALAGFLTWFARKRSQALVIACLLIGLAVGNNVRVTNDYRWVRTQQNRFFWQLSWRAPGITPGTAIFGEAEILPKTGLYSTAAGINIIYASPQASGKLPYWFFSLTREYAHEIPELVNGLALETSFRQFSFQGKSPASLIVYFQPSNADCMRILTPQDRNDPALSSIAQQSLPISMLARVQAEAQQPARPDSSIFGPEPEHGWCYFFQKADLARQLRDWEAVVKLGDLAQAQGYSMNNSQSNTPQEWIPFLEGYAHRERWKEAQEITRLALNANPKMAPRLCDAWKMITADLPQSKQQKELQSLLVDNGCRIR